jgi:hypothetical protein
MALHVVVVARHLLHREGQRDRHRKREALGDGTRDYGERVHEEGKRKALEDDESDDPGPGEWFSSDDGALEPWKEECRKRKASDDDVHAPDFLCEVIKFFVVESSALDLSGPA